MKKILAVLLAFALCLAFFNIATIADVQGDYVFVIFNGRADLCAYIGSEKNVVIPSNFLGAPVTILGPFCFCPLEGLGPVTVHIPDSVATMEEGAFLGCENLTTVTMDYGITYIGRQAFEGCKSLASVSIPGSVTTIDTYAFYGCENFKAVTIPVSVTTIGEYALGYYQDEMGQGRIVDGFTIYGYTNSVAHQYAVNNGIDFVSIGEVEFSLGDLNGDTKINAKDALAVLNFTVNKIELMADQQVAADVNKDEKIDAKDALEILKFAVKKPSVLQG